MLEFDEELTPRELEIFNLVILGNTNEQIGKHLFISFHTVKQHMFSIMSKCGLRDRFTMTLKHYNLPTWMDADDRN